MKRTLICALVLALSSPLFAQKSAIHFLSQLPDPPGDPCSFSSAQRQEYEMQINVVAEEIRAELQKRSATQKANVDENKDAWRKQMERQSGLNEQQLAKVRAAKGKMTKEEKRKLADEVLQERLNISLEEAEQLKKMDKEAKKAWTQAYAAEMMATAQAQTPEERAKAQEEQTRLMKLTKLTREQQDMMRENSAEAAVLQQQMRELDEEAQQEYVEAIKPIDDQIDDKSKDLRKLFDQHQVELEPFRKDELPRSHERAMAYGEVMKRQDEETSELNRQLNELSKQRNKALKPYCAQFSGKYADIVRRMVAWAKRAQPGFERYEEMENEKWKLQTQVPENVLLAHRGTIGLQEAANCAGLLRSVFKYRLFSGEYIEDGESSASDD